MMERANRYSELLAKAERKADKQRAEALGAGTGAFASADQEADSVSMAGAPQVSALSSACWRSVDGCFSLQGKFSSSSAASDTQSKGFDNRRVSVTGKRRPGGDEEWAVVLWCGHSWRFHFLPALEASSGASGMRVAAGKQVQRV
jgi:hypothetical protein